MTERERERRGRKTKNERKRKRRPPRTHLLSSSHAVLICAVLFLPLSLRVCLCPTCFASALSPFLSVPLLCFQLLVLLFFFVSSTLHQARRRRASSPFSVLLPIHPRIHTLYIYICTSVSPALWRPTSHRVTARCGDPLAGLALYTPAQRLRACEMRFLFSCGSSRFVLQGIWCRPFIHKPTRTHANESHFCRPSLPSLPPSLLQTIPHYCLVHFVAAASPPSASLFLLSGTLFATLI